MMSWFSLTPPSSPVTLPGVALPSAPVRTVASLAPLCCAMLALGRRSQPVLPQPGSGELRPSPSFWRKRGPWRFNCCSEGSGEPHPSTTQAAGGATALVSCLCRTRVGSFGDLLVVTQGITGWELQLLGCFCGSGAPARAAESCHRPCRRTEMPGGSSCSRSPGHLEPFFASTVGI